MALDKFNVTDNDVPCIAEVMGGYKSRIAIVRKCDVTSIPQKTDITDPTLTIDTVCEFTGQFAFMPNRAPIIVDCISESVTLSAETQGERAARNFKPGGSFKVRDSKYAAGLATVIINTPVFIIVQDHNGLIEMVGNDSFPSYIQPAFAGGDTASGNRGYTFTFDVPGQTRIKQYLASFDFDPVP